MKVQYLIAELQALMAQYGEDVPVVTLGKVLDWNFVKRVYFDDSFGYPRVIIE